MINELLRDRNRNKRILNTFTSSVAAKGLAIACTYVSVPLAYGALGEEQFGIWMTITSVLTGLQFADLGVGNGLLNMVTVFNARGDRDGTRQAVSSSFAILVLLGIAIVTVFGVAFSFLDWLKIYNISDSLIGAEAGIATAIGVICVAISLPLLTAQRVQMGYQEGMKSNMWISLGVMFSMLGVLACSRMGGELSAFILSTLGGPVLATALCWVYEFSVARPWLFPRFRYFDLETGRRVIRDGGQWTLLALTAFIGTALDTAIISYFFGAAEVAKYSVMSKLLTGLLLAQMLSAPLWPAFAEAIELGDLAWAKRTFRRSMAICTGLGVAGAAVLLFLSPVIIEWWVGVELVPSLALLSGFAMWCFVANFFAPTSAIMSDQRLLPTLTKLTATGAVTSFALKILVAPAVGPDFVIWATAIGYGLVCIPGIWVVHGLLNNK